MPTTRINESSQETATYNQKDKLIHNENSLIDIVGYSAVTTVLQRSCFVRIPLLISTDMGGGLQVKYLF